MLSEASISPDTTNHATDRADYLDRGLTPHLLDVSKKGLRAKFLKPVFPVSTTPRLAVGCIINSYLTDVDIPVSGVFPFVSTLRLTLKCHLAITGPSCMRGSDISNKYLFF